jgi:phosphoglycolate phosphatase
VSLKVKAVAIDLDGTLLNTAPDLAEAVNRMLVELGRPRIAEQEVMEYVGRGAAKLIKGLLTAEHDGEPGPQSFAEASQIFFKHYDEVLNVNTHFYAGALEGLVALKQEGFKLACVTNKPARFTVPLLKSKAVFDDFALVLSGDSLAEKKPHPMPLLYACQQFGIEPSELLMIGDSVSDVQAARAAVCPVFVVPYGYNRGVPAESLNGDRVVASILEASQLLEVIAS